MSERERERERGRERKRERERENLTANLDTTYPGYLVNTISRSDHQGQLVTIPCSHTPKASHHN